MASYAYTAINAAGLELTGEVQAPTAAAAREQLRVQGLLAEFLNEVSAAGGACRERRLLDTQRPLAREGRQAARSSGVLPAVRDHDRRGPERRHGAHHPRGADRRHATRRRDRRRAERRRRRGVSVSGAGQAPEDLLAHLRLDGRGRRGGRHPRRRPRPARHPDREGGEPEAPGQGRHGLSDDGHLLRLPGPGGDAPLHRPDLPEALRAVQREPPEVDAVHDHRVCPHAHPLVHHLSGDRPDHLRCSTAGRPARAAGSSGTASG